MYKQPEGKPDFSKIDEQISSWWKDNSIFEKSIKLREDADHYVFYDGPPFMSGIPHYATLLSSLPKDVIPRYQTMKGKKVERLWGWDCHGLPIENKVEEEIGLNGREEILEYGLKPFIEKCYEWNRVGIENWRWYIDKIGRWADLDNAYRTMDQDFMESVWWAFKTMWDKGLVYKGLRTSLYSTDSSTPVSNFEVSMDPDNYRDTEDTAIYVKFRLTDESATKLGFANQNVYMVAWTTTPWTIPSNFALAVNPEAKYSAVQHGDEILIVATDLASKAFTGLIDGDVEATKELLAEQLIGLAYLQIFDFLAAGPNDHRIYSSDTVTVQDGTGVLHVAPAFGEVDFEMGKEFGLSFSSDIDDAGNLTVGPWKGTYLRDANAMIAEELDKKGNLLRQEKYTHRLPYYRYKNPLIYKTEENYYVDIQKLKDQLIKSNEEINWIPEHFKEGRFKYVLESAPDWSISRSRFWGTAMPLWISESGKEIAIESRDHLMDLVNNSSNSDRIQKVKLELHENCDYTYDQCEHDIKAFIDSKENDLVYGATQELLSALRQNFFGETSEESRVKPLQVGEQRSYYLFNGLHMDMHRPFIDQVEFELEGEVYKRTEFTLDVWMDSGSMPFAQFHYPFQNKEHFEQNFPGDFIAEYTGQIRAWFNVLHVIANGLFSKPAFKNVLVTGVLAGTDGRKMSKSFKNYPDPKDTLNKYGADALRLYFLSSPIMSGNDMNFSEEELMIQTREVLIPLWNVYKYYVTYANLHDFKPADVRIDDYQNILDQWMFTRLHKTVNDVSESMNTYQLPKAIREINSLIDDTSKWYIRRSRDRFADGDKQVLQVLYEVLSTSLLMYAPIVPFTTEYISQGLDQPTESIHLADYPTADSQYIEQHEAIITDMEFVRSITEVGQSVRTTNGLKVRQPLAEMYVESESRTELKEWMKDILSNEINVKEVIFDKLPVEDKYLRSESANGSLKVALNSVITKELEIEGTAREVVRLIQSARKNAGLDVTDTPTITLTYTKSTLLDEVLSSQVESIVKSTGSKEIILAPTDEIVTGEQSVGGSQLNINIDR